jgi:hypothetical protein
MKYALVPVEATEAMANSGQHTNSEWLNDNAPIGEQRYREPVKAVYGTMLAASPNGGKVSCKQFNTICEAISREFDTKAQACAALKALGLEVEE